MRPPGAALDRSRQGGIAAVELALVLPVFLLLLLLPAVLGRAFYYNTVAQKAAHDAALYLAAVRQMDITSPARASQEMLVAQAILAAETPGMQFYASPTLQCDNLNCGAATAPGLIHVVLQLTLPADFFNDYAADNAGFYGMVVTADVTVPYVGN